mmetsp:Transcript_9880/g.24348  ORF Transcript_9880/g.24348 Transcript_9880/m.24348 type:complete len:238 (-) Transcript_9880:1585-2298(-)
MLPSPRSSFRFQTLTVASAPAEMSDAPSEGKASEPTSPAWRLRGQAELSLYSPPLKHRHPLMALECPSIDLLASPDLRFHTWIAPCAVPTARYELLCEMARQAMLSPAWWPLRCGAQTASELLSLIVLGSHTLTLPSRPAVASSEPSGDRSTKRTGPACASALAASWRAFGSHTMTAPSDPPEAMEPLSAEKATLSTRPLCPLSTPSSFIALWFHTRTDPSRLPDASAVPSGENATL